jgi:hypothetical protein
MKLHPAGISESREGMGMRRTNGTQRGSRCDDRPQPSLLMALLGRRFVAAPVQLLPQRRIAIASGGWWATSSSAISSSMAYP